MRLLLWICSRCHGIARSQFLEIVSCRLRIARADGGPGGQLGRGQIVGERGDWPTASSSSRGTGVGREVASDSRPASSTSSCVSCIGGSRETCLAPGPGDAARVVCARRLLRAMRAANAGRTSTYVGSFSSVERRLRRVRNRPLGRAFFAAGGVEGQQARMQERALPVGVQSAAILVAARVGLPGALGKVEELPVALGLVRLHARPADRADQQAACNRAVSRMNSASSRQRDCRASSRFCGSRCGELGGRGPKTAGRRGCVVISRTMCFTSQPLSMNSTASQSSSSGCVGGSPCAPKSSSCRATGRRRRTASRAG